MELYMANFDFLLSNTEYASFSNLAVEAEKQYNKSTMFCGFSARKALEQAVKWMYSVDSDFRMPYSDNIQTLVHEPSFVNQVPRNIQRDIQIIIKAGNSAVHDSSDVEKRVALVSLKALFNFMNWLNYTYGDSYTQHTFSEDAIPKKKIIIVREKPSSKEFEKTNPDVKFNINHNFASEKQNPISASEIEKFKLELEEREKTIQELRKQLSQSAKEIQSRKTQPKTQTLVLEKIDEKTTRKLFIDADLKALGWQFIPDMIVEEYPVSDMGFEKTNGFVDYVLFGKDHLPLAVVEAKKTTKDANIGKQQAKDYADCLERKFGRRPFIFYTNGFDCNFWDDTQNEPRQVSMIFSQADLEKLMDRRTQKKDLDTIQINAEISGRDYQQEAIKSVVHTLKESRRTALLVMATGTGKTRTAISLVDVLSRGNYVTNILFLADRIELVEQAHDNFKKLLPSMSICNLLDPKSKKENKNARIVFSTYPTILNAVDTEEDDNKQRLYTPAHFDLIIIDEAHRSIFKKYKAIFEYFDALTVGLTATPRDEIEKSTFEFFKLPSGNPTFYYSYEEAIERKYLVPYYAYEDSTKFSDEGITYDNLSEEDRDNIEENQFEEITSDEINKYVFNKDTIRKVIEKLMENGIKSDYGDKIGKTIIFASNKNHAQAIVETIDEMYPQYHGELAARIVCDDSKVSQTMKLFKKPDSSLKIAVSVDMLDTGVDVPEVVNLVFFKKIKSKIKFDQMIGRGTRLCPDLICTDSVNKIYAGKKYFYIFDWLRNFEFFRKNPEGMKETNTKSLSESIFERRCQIIQFLQDANYSDEEHSKLRDSLVKDVNGQVASLNTNLMPVHNVLEYVLKFRKLKSFECLSNEDVTNLSEKLAPLVYMKDTDVFAKGFDNIIYSIMLGKMRGESYTAPKNRVIGIVNDLLKKSTIPQVKEKITFLQRVNSDSYWQNASVVDCEEVRNQIRELVNFLNDKKEFKVKFVDFVDEIINIREGESLASDSDNFEEYKKRVNSYISKHLDDNAIKKLRMNEKLSQEDFDSLNHIFTEELGNKEQFDKIRDNRSIGVFIRSVAKMDRENAYKLFAEFMNEENWNFEQIQFMKTIRECVIEQGEINLERLAEGKPPFDRPRNFFLLFNTDAQMKIVSLLKNINENAA